MEYNNLKRLDQNWPTIGNVERLSFICGIHLAETQLKEFHVDKGGIFQDPSELLKYPVIITAGGKYVLHDLNSLLITAFLGETGNAYRTSGEIYAEKKSRR